MGDRGDRILPDQHFGRNQRPKVARTRTHVAVRQLEPGAGEGIGELIGVLVEPLRDLRVFRVHLECQVGGEHHRRMAARRIMGVGHQAGGIRRAGNPLRRPGGAFDLDPVKAEKVVEIVVVPCGRGDRPGALQAAGDRVGAVAGAEAVLPAQPLFLDRGPFRFRPDIDRRVGGTMRLAEGVTPGDQGDRFLVIHRHARKGFADVAGRGQRVRGAVRAFGVDVDQAHLHGGERVFQLAVTGIARIAQPGVFHAPVDVFFRFPDIRPSAAEAEGLESHRIQRAIAGQHHQVGPGNLVAVFLLDRPEQAARLVEVAVVGPAVQRGEALRAFARAATAVTGAVGAGTVPGHADEERPVMAVIGWPPLLRGGHQRVDVLLERCHVQLLELFGIAEARAHRVRQGRVLMKDLQVQLVRPPVAVRSDRGRGRGAGPVDDRALACGRAVISIHHCSPVLAIGGLHARHGMLCRRSATVPHSATCGFLAPALAKSGD